MSDSDFIIKSINNANWEHELEIVGFDKLIALKSYLISSTIEADK